MNEGQSQRDVVPDPHTPSLPVSEEISSATLPDPAGNSEGQKPESDDLQPAHGVSPRPDRVLPFVQHVHSYLNEYIRFADQKAAVLLGVITAVVAVAVDTGLYPLWMPATQSGWPVRLLALVSCVSLAISIAFGLRAILPRLRPARAQGLVFWDSIARSYSPERYADVMLSLSNESVTRELIDHCHELAVVCSAKYCALSIALWSGALGIAASGLLLLVS